CTEDDRAAKSHDVAKAENETNSVKVEDHSAAVGERFHHRHKLQVEVFLPHVKCSHQQVVDPGNAGCLQEQLGLRTALLARYQNLRNCCCFREGELPVHFAHKIAAQRNEEQHAKTSAGKADKDGLHWVRIEVQDVQSRQREDSSGGDAAGSAADSDDD